MIERRRVDVCKEVWVCDECGKGEMKPTGMQLMSNPPQIEHQCSNKECRHVETARGESYPKIHYEEQI